MIDKFNQNINCLSSLTIAETHPWIWKITENNQIAQNSWTPNNQKNSQNLPRYFVEHASIIINKREIINPITRLEISFNALFITILGSSFRYRY